MVQEKVLLPHYGEGTPLKNKASLEMKAYLQISDWIQHNISLCRSHTSFTDQASVDDSSRRPLAGSLAGAGWAPLAVMAAAVAWFMPAASIGCTGPSVAAESEVLLPLPQPSAQLPQVYRGHSQDGQSSRGCHLKDVPDTSEI